MNADCKKINCEKLLKEVMAADFMALDLHLYLNTHPCDIKTIALFNNAAMRSKMLHEKYERECGPLTPGAVYDPCRCWKWIESPWPWERRS